MEKPKKSNYKFHFGMCWSFRKEKYEADLKIYKEWEKQIKNNPNYPNPMNPNEIEVIDYELVVPLKK